jgi:hypothetical protein
MRVAARRWRVSLATVRYWVQRVGEVPLSAVDWADRSSRPHHVPGRVSPAMEERVVEARRELAASELGFVGAVAIREQMQSQCADPVPSVRTIGRILTRRGVLDGRPRVRRAAPPPGWYLPEAAAGRAEIDHFDLLEDLRIEGGPLVDVLTGCALWGSAVMADPAPRISARRVVESLLAYWKRVGRPAYAQFDNDTRFQGGHNHPDVIGRVTRLCLALDITPVFAPPAEQGFQNVAEAYNGLWTRKVWQRFHHQDLCALVHRSDRFVYRYDLHRARRREHTPPRRPVPPSFTFDVHAHPHGQIVYLRRTNESGVVYVMGRRWLVDPLWPHRLVRAHVDLDSHSIRFFRLRRKAPADQPLILETAYVRPHRKFQEA